MREPFQRSRGRFALAFFLGLAAAYSRGSTAAEIEVPTDLPTIAQAIQSASPGDTISILPGEYDEVLTITKDLTLRGAGGDSTVVKTALQGAELLHVEGAAVTIEDLRLAGGFAASKGIVAAGGSSLTVRRSKVVRFLFSAIDIAGGNLIVEDAVVGDEGIQVHSDIGIRIQDAAFLVRKVTGGDLIDHIVDVYGDSNGTIEECTFTGSNTINANGVRVSGNSTITVRDSVMLGQHEPGIPETAPGSGIQVGIGNSGEAPFARIHDNEIHGFGAGINFAGGSLAKASIYRNVITGNVRDGVETNAFSGVGIDLGGGPHHSPGENEISGNEEFNVRHRNSSTLIAKCNDWGSIFRFTIDQRIYDDDEDAGSGPVVFEPVQGSPIVVALPPPAGGTPAGGRSGFWIGANSFQFLQDALAAAGTCSSFKIPEIWVVAGTHIPILGGDPPPERRRAAFRLVDGIRIYGGFSGSETLLEERDVLANRTVLSGDLGGNDGDAPAGLPLADNSFHVVVSEGNASSAILDGFIITGGNAVGASPDSAGGGLLVTGGSPTIVHCTFLANAAEVGGGISALEGGEPTVRSCRLIGNTARRGGGMACASGRPASGAPILLNCVFSGNQAEGGGALYVEGTEPALASSTIAGNRAASGGGILNEGGNPVAVNAIFWGNAGGEIVDGRGSTSRVSFSDVQGGFPGPRVIDADPLFAASAGGDRIPGTEDDDLRLRAGSPCIDVGDNAAVPRDLTEDLDGNPRIAGGTIDLGAYEWGERPTLTVRPGDCNRDGGLDIGDPICLLGHLFMGQPEELPCGPGGQDHPANIRLLDANGDGGIDLSDAVHVLGFLFLGTDPPSLGTDCTEVEGCPGRCAS